MVTTFQPTWYSAVPTMHQAILAQARQHRERVATAGALHPLCIGSAAAARLRRTGADFRDYRDRVLRDDGDGFLAHRVQSAAAAPAQGGVGRHTGGVGRRDHGRRRDFAARGQTGQVVVRGASVMAGYDGDPSATEAAFAGDWFKTGDLGFFDDDGYLFLAGRIREMINRGGEKIAPQEVDEVLLEHPAVAEAVTFAVPHATLGEDVASAVVLRPGAPATPKDIRQFAIGRIADFKVPRQVFIVSEIPKGPTGKVQRIGLAARLGLAGRVASARTFVAPRTPLETALAEFWAEILQVEQIGIHDDFFASGGDSLLAAHVLSHMYQITQVELEVSRFFEAPTVAEVARHLETLIQAGQAPRPSSAIVRVPREDRRRRPSRRNGFGSCSKRCRTCLFSMFSMRFD